MKTRRQSYFPRRIPEPKEMGEIEQEVFEKASKESYKRWMVPLVDDALSQSKLETGQILDVGCGPGLLTKEFAERSKKFRVVGIDISPHALRLAKENCRSVSNTIFKKASVYRLPFPDDSFGLVVCKDSLHHFNKLATALKEMRRVTKHGGIIYLQDLRRNLPWCLLKMVIPPQNTFQKLQYYSARAAYTKSEIKRIFKKLGFKNYNVKTRLITSSIRRVYSKLGIDPSMLKQAFQSRFVAVIKKK